MLILPLHFPRKSLPLSLSSDHHHHHYYSLTLSLLSPLSSLTHSDRSTTSTSGKRQRYAPPNASKVLGEPLADDLELDLEGTGGKDNSRKKVVTDGYDSDSSGGEDDPVLPTRKGKGKEGGEEEDEDMFGDPNEAVDKELDGLGKGKERERKEGGKEWLEMGDIEGQEFTKRDMRDDDEDDGMEEEEEDEEAEEEEYEQVDDHANDDDAPRSRRSKKGMGFQLSYVCPLSHLSHPYLSWSLTRQ